MRIIIVKRLTTIVIYGFMLMISYGRASARNGSLELTCLSNPVALKDHLSLVCSVTDSAKQIATFEVIASNPELSICGCTLDVIMPQIYLKLVPNSVTGFGESIGGVMDTDGHCRIATAIRAGETPRQAQGVLLRFKMQIDLKPHSLNHAYPMTPRVDLQRSGLVDTEGKFINGSSIYIDVCKLLIK